MLPEKPKLQDKILNVHSTAILETSLNSGCSCRDKNGFIPLENLDGVTTGLAIFHKLLELRGLLKGSDDNASAANNLPGVSFAVDLAKASPLSQLLGVRDLDALDVVLLAEGLDQASVSRFITVS